MMSFDVFLQNWRERKATHIPQNFIAQNGAFPLEKWSQQRGGKERHEADFDENGMMSFWEIKMA
jgi:hypothetical protein